MRRRLLVPIALLAAMLHGVGIARSTLPAQDGLKFLRVARGFHAQPWAEVVRASDQHPLYPALIALTQPVIAATWGSSADSWRIAAQVVSAMASIAILLPIFAITRRLFEESAAVMATLLFVLLPIPSEIGHDTLADPLALLACATALWCALATSRTRSLIPAIGCGLASGLGYLARPEVVVVPIAFFVASMTGFYGRTRAFRALSAGRGNSRHDASPDPGIRKTIFDSRNVLLRQIGSVSVVALTIIGSYAVVKGEVSEKLAVRTMLRIRSPHDAPAHSIHPLPPGLDDPRWNFSAKEEADHASRMTFSAASSRLISRWSEVMGFALVPLVMWGAWKMPGRGGRIVGVYAVLYAALLVRHAMASGYLATRHTIPLAVASLPFAGAAIWAGVRAVRDWRETRSPGSVERTRFLRVLAVGGLVLLAVSAQMHHPPHPSRWGHNQAGKWLSEHARRDERVLDTRGWATFVSGRAGLDYWHVRQALTDPDLSFLVVGEDERTADSPRAETLRALLAYAAEPVASFPEREGGHGVGVRVYRFHRPSDWQGMRP